MERAAINPVPGMVLVVRTSGFGAEFIRFGEMLLGADDLENHVAIIDHKTNDTWWAVEGRPGGVGWVDATAYLKSPWTISNQGQVLTAPQWQTVTKTMRGLLGTPYDWTAIEQDAIDDLHLPDLWAEKWHGIAPGHVVCSSVAAWAYNSNNIKCPRPDDLPHVQPADWADFILINGYQENPPVTR